MKIAKLIENNVVISADPSVQVTDAGVFGNGWENQHLAGKVAIEEVDVLPNGYEDYAWAYVNGVWTAVNQNVIDAVTNQKAALIRAERNQRLSGCDWTQVADAPVDKALWADYRQALRDVTAQDGFPWTVEWPVQPE